MATERSEAEAAEITLFKYPSIPAAFEFVLPAYDMAERRLRGVETRIQLLVGFAGTSNVAALTVAGALVDDVNFSSGWFIGNVVLLGIVLVIGMFAMSLGTLTVPALGDFHAMWLDKRIALFKSDAILNAATHQKTNLDLVNLKGHTATALSILFVVQIALLMTWIAEQVG